jgi:hypothetical protein
MALVRESVARFIQGEGHRVDVSIVDEKDGIAEILFRTRGQVFSVMTYENNPGAFTISTAYEIPDWARERSTNAETLRHVEEEYPEVQLMLAHDGSLFVASMDDEPGSAEAFTVSFWDIVAHVRDAGSQCIERIMDRTESRAAAEKFISSFMKGER